MDNIIDNLGYAVDVIVSGEPRKAIACAAGIIAIACTGIMMLCRHKTH